MSEIVHLPTSAGLDEAAISEISKRLAQVGRSSFALSATGFFPVFTAVSLRAPPIFSPKSWMISFGLVATGFEPSCISERLDLKSFSFSSAGA